MGYARDLLLVLALMAALATIVAAQPAPSTPARVEIHGPLEAFNLSGCFYRGMNITLFMTLSNWLSSSLPPMCPSWAPADASLTCSCSMEPIAWWPNASWSLVLGPSEEWSSTLSTLVPGLAGLRNTSAGFGCLCSWQEWCTSVTVSTSYSTTSWRCGYTTITQCWPPPRGCETYTSPVTCYSTTSTTTTITVTSTSSATAAVAALENITVLPREVNESLLALDINVSLGQVLMDYPLPGMSSALVNVTVSLYNLGLGLRLGNETPIPLQRGMLLLHNLTVYVDGVPAINLSGYGAPAQSLPVNASEPEPSAVGSVTLTLEPPGELVNEYTFNITLCYTEDDTEPTRTCLNDTLTVPLPFGWRLVRYIADDCSVLNETWEVVPANETGYETVLAEDNVEPSLREDHDCIVAEADVCESVKLDVYGSDGILVVSRKGRGSITWCPLEPGAYTAVAVDSFNNTVLAIFNVTWTVGPPPSVKRALLSLASMLIAVMIGIYVIFEGRWPLREV